MDINSEVIERAAANVKKKLVANQAKIAAAYLKCDRELSVGLTVEFKPLGEAIEIKTTISFVAERVKSSSKDEVYPPDPITLANERSASGRGWSGIRAERGRGCGRIGIGRGRARSWKWSE